LNEPVLILIGTKKSRIKTYNVKPTGTKCVYMAPTPLR